MTGRGAKTKVGPLLYEDTIAGDWCSAGENLFSDLFEFVRGRRSKDAKREVLHEDRAQTNISRRSGETRDCLQE